jgi:hypothetical protein
LELFALLVLAVAMLCAAVVWAVLRVVPVLQAEREEAARGRALGLLALFAPGIAAASEDPKALLVWQPLASAARRLFATEFAGLDAAAGGRFPFTAEALQAAHARWTADWLAWERAHDGEYKLKVTATEHELAGSPLLRPRLDAIEREKLDRYQRRYEEYVRVAKALQALAGSG